MISWGDMTVAFEPMYQIFIQEYTRTRYLGHLLERKNQKRKCIAQLSKSITPTNSTFSFEICKTKQTIGVPIGPETSRLLAEIVSVAIDTKLQKQLKLTSQNALRFVDDHIIAIRRDLDEGKIHYALSRELAEFELELNFAKTKQIGVGGDSEPAC
jgi:hypothetical protein